MKTLRTFYLALLANLFAMAVLIHPAGARSPWRGGLELRTYEGMMGGYSPEGKISLIGIALMSIVIRLVYRERWEMGPGHPLQAAGPVAPSLGYDAVLATIGVLSLALLSSLLPRTDGALDLPNVFYLVLIALLTGAVELVGTIGSIPPRGGGGRPGAGGKAEGGR